MDITNCPMSVQMTITTQIRTIPERWILDLDAPQTDRLGFKLFETTYPLHQNKILFMKSGLIPTKDTVKDSSSYSLPATAIAKS